MRELDIDIKTIESYRDKILKDKIFADSPRYRDLLHFIITESIFGKYIKELNIAAQIYGENFGEDKSDGRVRVYMFNLRKRLDQYYSADGASDEVIFTLKKGSYNMQFKRREAESKSNGCDGGQSKGFKSWIYFAAGVLLTMCLFALTLLPNRSVELYCWSGFVENGSPTLCVLADQIILQRKLDEGWVNSVNVNNIKNKSMFYDYMLQNRSDSLRLSTYTLYSKAIPYSLHRLTEWLYEYDTRISLKPDSDFAYDDLNGNNIIYLGQIKTMDASGHIFLKNSKIFSADQKFIYVTRDGKRVNYRAKFNNDEKLTIEYALVSYMPLDGSNKALFFASNHDVGTMATLNSFTNEEFLKHFYESLPSPDSYFNALFKVEGVGRTNINCELIELEVINP